MIFIALHALAAAVFHSCTYLYFAALENIAFPSLSLYKLRTTLCVPFLEIFMSRYRDFTQALGVWYPSFQIIGLAQ
jgi:hypothetical protein